MRSQSGVIRARENGAVGESQTSISEPTKSGSRALALLNSPWQKAINPFLIAILVALNLIAFLRTINGYFLADDLVHVSYLTKVFDGHPELLLQNFFSNWMQTQGTEFYRPLISLTLALDFLFWRASAVGYHLSNLVFQTLSSIFLFLTVKRMFPETPAGERILAAFLASALFACHPLHAEVVSWIIGRVDSVTTTFLFLSFYLYLKSSQEKGGWARPASIICFVLALMSKEMAITLPPAVFLYELLSASAGSFFQKFREALQKTRAYFVVLILYLIGRTLALGTIAGGYAGSIKDGLQASTLKRWFLDGSLTRMFLPFNEEVFSGGNKLRNALKLLYLAASIIFIARSVPLMGVRSESDSGRWLPLKKLAFAFGWLVICLLPTLQVWNLTTHLQGSRFVYMATAPLSLMIAFLVFPGTGTGRKGRLLAASVMVAVALITLNGFIAERNNRPWAKAMRSVKELRSQLEARAAQIKGGEKLVLLNLPQQYKGAHMLYNAATFEILLKPPLSRSDFSNRVLTFEPVTYGDSQLINVSRFRRLLTGGRARFLKWDMAAERLYEVALENAGPASPLSLAGIGKQITLNKDSCLVSPEVSLNSTAFDTITVDLTLDSGAEEAGNLMLGWRAKSDPVFRAGNQMTQPSGPGRRTYTFHVSERKGWLTAGIIDAIKLDIYPKPATFTLNSVTAASNHDSVPVLTPHPSLNKAGRTMEEDNSGIARPGNVLGNFSFDVSGIPGAVRARYEVSNPDSWFEHYSATYRDSAQSEHVSKSGILNGVRGEAQSLDISDLTRPGFYEIRIFALDSGGKILGYSSDPLNFQLSAKDLRQAKK